MEKNKKKEEKKKDGGEGRKKLTKQTKNLIFLYFS